MMMCFVVRNGVFVWMSVMMPCSFWCWLCVLLDGMIACSVEIWANWAAKRGWRMVIPGDSTLQHAHAVSSLPACFTYPHICFTPSCLLTVGCPDVFYKSFGGVFRFVFVEMSFFTTWAEPNQVRAAEPNQVCAAEPNQVCAAEPNHGYCGDESSPAAHTASEVNLLVATKQVCLCEPEHPVG